MQLEENVEAVHLCDDVIVARYVTIHQVDPYLHDQMKLCEVKIF